MRTKFFISTLFYFFYLGVAPAQKKNYLKSRNITSIDYKGSTDWQIKPTTNWNYSLLLNKENVEESIIVRRNPISKYPFSDFGELIYSEKVQKYIPWNFAAPVELMVQGKRIADWGIKNNSADVPPAGSINLDYNIETLTLVPYGCTRLRITELPVIR